MNRLDDKVALISGGARGIGGETAQLMAKAGAKVVVADVLDDVGQRTVDSIRSAGGHAEYIHLDVTREEDWTAAIDCATGRFDKLDILVNNAGVFIGKAIEEISLDEWNKLVAVNMTGVFLGTKLAAPALREAAKSSEHGSAIVNLASIAGIVGSQLDPLYSMTKGGVTLFTKSAALEFARKGYRIRVNSIHPGVIQTDMGEQTFIARAQRTGTNDTSPVRQLVSDSVPWGRLGVPLDIAKGIVFLASDDAGYMNGTGLVVDGGFTAA
jgi:NAD(P)-dependent dehydrogenase (short-subunit alcohol dehydrogenase family)